jgi:hypothetical protein
MVTESGKCLIDPCLICDFYFDTQLTALFLFQVWSVDSNHSSMPFYFLFPFSEHNGTSAHKLLAPQVKLSGRGLAGLSAAHQWVRTSVGRILIFFQYPPGRILNFLKFLLTHRVSNIRILIKI